MPEHNEFVEFLLDQLQQSGIDILSLRARAMFGGYGIYFDDVMFGLVADDELYLKLGEHNTADFEAAGLPRFSYEKSGKRYDMSYAAAPVEMYDDPEMMHSWASKAIDAALAADRKKPKKSRKTGKKNRKT